ncbi:discoidin domain-containing protein [Streptomyces sp. NPDC057456]|uniref:discoidin domain-containing protein n=1 Tax=Streptomyces sp. NPDC057456 TaxID=3346139 RepID=UPI0036B50506
MSMKATFADFSVDPARLSNAVVTHDRAEFGGSHLTLNAGGTVTLDFEVADPEDIPEATLTVTALVSRLGSAPGHAPIDVLLQGEPLAEDLTVPGGGDLPQDNVFAVPALLLKPGTNTLEIRASAEARSMLRLYRITLDSIDERGRSERALAAQAARNSVFAFRTELRAAHAASSTPWEAAPRLVFHLDRDEHSLPAQLGWRGEDGAESAISFQSNMSDFHGCHRSADGTAYEYRGRLTGDWAFPEGIEETSASGLHRFRTEEGYGGDWHSSHELRLLVDDGGAAVERVTWRDQRGNSGVAMLQAVSGEAGTTDVRVTDVEASDEFAQGGETADNLLTGSRTKWLVHDDTAQLHFTLARSAVVTSYTLTSANDCPDRDPRDWTLDGSHDGRTWTRVDSRAGETFSGRFETREFRLRAPAPGYRYYRLDITDNSGADETQLARVRFVEGPTGRAFTGYYQRYNEGPIGYRGTPVPTPAPVPASLAIPAPLLAADLEAAVQSLTDTAQTLAALATRLRES